MAINGNRILGNISNNSFVLCLARSLIMSEDVYFLPVYDTIHSRMTWVSATPDNLPSSAEGHIKWIVFKVKNSGNGKFRLEGYLSQSLDPTDSPELEDLQSFLDLSQSTLGNHETVLSLSSSDVNLTLNMIDNVTLSSDELWSGVWYNTSPNSNVTASKILNNSGWAGFDDLSDLAVYPAQTSFIVCGNVQQARNFQCSTLRFFESLKFVENWVIGTPDYNLKDCETGDHPTSMFCLFSNNLSQANGNIQECNGFRGYHYGNACNGDEYADVCGSNVCIFNEQSSLACIARPESSNIFGTIIILAVVVVVMLSALAFIFLRKRTD